MTSCTEGVCPSEPVDAWSNREKQKTSWQGHWTNVCATRVLFHLEVLQEGPSPWHSPARTRIGPLPQTIVRPLQRRGPPAELARRPLLTLGMSALSFFVPASVPPLWRGDDVVHTMSWMNVLVRTRAPASQQTLAKPNPLQHGDREKASRFGRMDFSHPVWLADDVQIDREEFSPSRNSFATVANGISGLPCSPPSPHLVDITNVIFPDAC